MNDFRTLDDLAFAGKRAIVRLDLNVPMKDGKVTDSTRIDRSAATLKELVKKGATHITVTTTMFTPGGSHSEVEIPEILDHLRPQYPGIELRYAWPFDLELVANTLAEQVRRFS